MEIVKIPVEKVNPAAYNPRKDLQPGDAEYEKLKKSIAEFDIVEPLVWNRRTGNLVGGHQRLKILREMGFTEVEVSVVDLEDAKEKALNLALNKISGEWDLLKLKDVLLEIDTGQFDIEITGFDTGEIEELLTRVFEPEQGLTDDDEIPEHVETVCRLGDLWRLGGHRLLCGDATRADDVKRLLGEDKPFLMVTDPPYGVEYDPEWRKERGQAGSLRTGKVYNDDRCDWKDAWALFGGDVAYVWHAGVHAHIVAQNLIDCGFDIRAQIIWCKQNIVFSRGAYHGRHEPCWYVVRAGRNANWQGDRKQSTVWEIQNANPVGGAKDDFNTEHSTQKPVECMARPIRHHTTLNQQVYDPFGGSGTTIIACEKLGRGCLMMELDPHYCDVIIQRWENYTGDKAELIDGKTPGSN